ncbi:unnamed protein product [Blepharisma stoltei]|uniref:DNA/RNA helicase protein n=1 Tax=Blepharisma stoltei TaxID=1481888 RepID=A0AAU9IP39_9CILI|nr:unnamed protein product [Blepharisma stoltei]
MESENFKLFTEITGEQDIIKITNSLQRNNFNVDLAIDQYYRELHRQNLSQELMLKRKFQDSQQGILLGTFDSDAYAISSIQNVKNGHRLSIRLPKQHTFGKNKKKEDQDKTVRFAMEPNGFSVGKFPQAVSEFLYPLISGNLIEIEVFVLDSQSSLSLLDSLKVTINVILKPEALCDPAQTAKEVITQKNASADEYFTQREAFQKLFKLLNLEKTQSALVNHKREPLNDKLNLEESKGMENVDKALGLDDLNGESELSEMEPAPSFRSCLYSYQKQALAWMYERETHTKSNRNNGELHHLWEEYKAIDGRFIYFNHYTGQVATKFPEGGALCKGGILADEMGLGKTVMVVSLLHTHRRGYTHSPKKSKNINEGGTLIVLPLSLMTQWHSEIENHGTGLKVMEYYSEKTKSLRELGSPDVVLTTYGVVQTDCATSGPLFKMNWFRIILDEAHNIRNRETGITKSCLKLQGLYKWALTGTPIQNRLDDLYSLISFLEVEPWNDYLWWNRVITKPFNRQDPNVFEALRRLLKPIVLRRTKASKLANGSPIISLPPLNIDTIYLAMHIEERRVYDRLFNHTKARFRSLISQGRLKSYISSVFELLLRLRQLCNHPFLIMNKNDADPLESIDKFFNKVVENTSENYINELVDKIKQGEAMDCPVCLDMIDDAVITKCGHFMCRLCGVQQVEKNRNCPLCKAVLTAHDLTTVPRENKFQLDITKEWRSSAKIEYLLNLLQESNEPTVVFSQWTTMLDLLEIALKKAEISYARLDGSLNKNQRENALQLFKNGRQVMLITLKAGGVGINLTYASRVILMDPWWNPAVENQAIERVHRIGQNRTVRAIKLICHDTVEERMLELQARKQEISEGAFTAHTTTMSLDNLKIIFDEDGI